MATREPVEPGIWKITGKYAVRYEVVVDVGRDPATGKRRQRSERFATLKEARDWRVKKQHERREHSYLEPSDQPLGEYLDQWLASLRRPNVATRRIYAWHVRKVASVLGGVPLGELQPTHVDRLIATLVARGHAPKTIHETHQLLKRALDRAARRGLLRANPAVDIELPALTRTPLTVWNLDEVRRFLDATADDARLGALWHLALTTGLRAGEMLALAWESVDLDAGTLLVERHLSESEESHSHEVIVPLAKTVAGYRQIALPGSTVGSLRVHRYHQLARRDVAGEAWQDLGLVFDWGDGSMIDPRALLKALHRACAKHGMKRLRVHDLRHTFASLALTRARLPLFVVSRILGHKSIQTTAAIYGHLLEDVTREAAIEVERALWGLPDLDL